MPLTVRQIPFDLPRALEQESFDALARDLGAPHVVGVLALGVMTEFLELLLGHLNNAYGLLSERDDARLFLQQELRHSSALRAVNRHLIGEDYGYTRIGRIPASCRQIYAADLARFEAAARDPSLRPAVLADYGYLSAVNELVVGLPLALAEFDQLESDHDVRLEHPAFSYVFLYHAAEEAEHTHVTYEAHRESHGVDILSDAALEASAALFDRFLSDHAQMMTLLAERLGVALDPETIATLPMRSLLRGQMDRLLKHGPEPTLYADLRRSCVETWDRRWEPVFREQVERRSPSS